MKISVLNYLLLKHFIGLTHVCEYKDTVYIYFNNQNFPVEMYPALWGLYAMYSQVYKVMYIN